MLLPRHLHLLPGRQSLGGVVAPALLPPLCCGPLRLRQEKTDTIRCIKSCRPNDVTCVLAPVHTISHTVVSLPTFREFTRPEGEWPLPRPGTGRRLGKLPGQATPLPELRAWPEGAPPW